MATNTDKVREAFRVWLDEEFPQLTAFPAVKDNMAASFKAGYQAATQANKCEYIETNGTTSFCRLAESGVEANKEVLEEVSELIKDTDFHYGVFMDVNDCADFCQEEKLAALRNLLLALGEQEKAIEKLKQLIGEG